jgi:exosortase family protein XrtF
LELFKQYRPFFIFLLKFFSVYAVLTVIYHYYLNSFDSSAFEVDSFTIIVANQVKWFTSLLGYVTELKPHTLQPSIKFIINGHYVARIVEGCNALSVIILFAAFVVAFTGKWKTTLFFILSGSLLIHIFNVLRIGLIGISLLRYPQYEHILHGVIFPAIIYGTVFLLWVIWVNKFSTYAGQHKN